VLCANWYLLIVLQPIKLTHTNWRTDMSQIAVLGTGAMGSRIVQNLLKAGHQVVIYNRTKDKVAGLIEQGATYAETPKAAAKQADIVISMVTDDAVSRKVWLDAEIGAILGLQEGAIAIESSTLTVNWVKELATVIQSRGAKFLDAPVVGSRPQADAGKLIYLVGGETETLEAVRAVLSTTGSIQVVGAVGQGTAMKLAVNALFGIQVAALAEVVGMLEKQGIAIASSIQYLNELPVISPAVKLAGNLMLSRNHVPLFPIALVEKDFRNVEQSAQAVNAAVPVSSAVHQIYQSAIAQGYGDDNLTGIAQLFFQN
jgi:3-hydroxyisobutyrate dehydrogenase